MNTQELMQYVKTNTIVPAVIHTSLVDLVVELRTKLTTNNYVATHFVVGADVWQSIRMNETLHDLIDLCYKVTDIEQGLLGSLFGSQIVSDHSFSVDKKSLDPRTLAWVSDVKGKPTQISSVLLQYPQENN